MSRLAFSWMFIAALAVLSGAKQEEHMGKPVSTASMQQAGKIPKKRSTDTKILAINADGDAAKMDDREGGDEMEVDSEDSIMSKKKIGDASAPSSGGGCSDYGVAPVLTASDCEVGEPE